MRRHRVLAAGGSTVRALVEDALDAIDVDVVPLGDAGSSPGHVGHVYLLRRGTVRVTAVDDHEARCWYLVVESPDDGAGREVEDALAAVLATRTFPELLDDAERHPTEHAGAAVRRMALGAPDDADPRALRVLGALLTDPDVGLRTVGVEAATLTGWREAVPLLERVRDTDADREMRRFAQVGLDLLASP